MAKIRPERVVIIDIDGLRPEVYFSALKQGNVPHLQRIVGSARHVPALSTAPSVTFASQASIFTGAHPADHRVPGNECFDRLGLISKGRPRHFGFDVGDTLAVDDAIAVFSDGLADRLLNPETPTVYESAAAQGKTSLVAFNMYARGADYVARPSLIDIARFTKGKGSLGLEAGAYDTRMLDDLESLLRKAEPKPDLITAYFMGLDHHSHLHGPVSQAEYLADIVDPQIGRLVDLLEELNLFDGTLFALVSDHGQIETPGDDAHSIRLGFPFDMELSPLFEALGLDLHDRPGEDPKVDAVVSLNGGLAQVYLRHREAEWSAFPRYEDDVLRVAQAFHEMNEQGKYRSELKGTLDLILVRDAESAGDWRADYRAYLGDGITQPFADWLAEHPDLPYADADNRLRLANSSMSGDLILSAKAANGVYFGGEGLRGVHGSLLSGDSEVVLSFSLPTGSEDDIASLYDRVDSIIEVRCAAEGNRQPSVADMSAVIRDLWLG
ncbi:MAG: alkaline phosphatase family protein [Anaerolineae bacterium]|nr:alkaline phosphatase family protein [Anaerolineae bacterium]